MNFQRSARNSSWQIAGTPANIGDGDGGVVEIKYSTDRKPVETTVKREGL